MTTTRERKRSTLAVALFLALGTVAPLQAGAATRLGFTLGVRNAPPPPTIVIVERPRFIAVPGTMVYAVGNTDYDVFRYGGTYYVYNDGYWYRSRKTSGPYVVVDVRSVPMQILSVPPERWKHHPHGGPPGQMKKGNHRGHGKH